MLNINNTVWSKVTADDVKKQIDKVEVSENFFFEFKGADVNNSKMMKEISAFSNTFGGYIFIGVEDDKTITGRGEWTEERLHTTIHDSISPTPLYDVKEFIVDNQAILVVRVEEGAMPPYIVNDGKIYERISSGSFPIKDSAKLNQLILKQRDYDYSVANTIEIEPIDRQSERYPQNLCGYIDIGFSVVCRDLINVILKQDQVHILEDVASVIAKTTDKYNISIVGARIIITLFHRTAHDLGGNEVSLDSGIQNFIEILNDGSVRLRILIDKTNEKSKASINIITELLRIFQEVYYTIVGNDFEKNFVYARKYEKLTVLRQFTPYYYLNEQSPEDVQHAYEQLETNHNAKFGEKYIVIGNRFPSNGYRLIDQHLFNESETEWDTHNIISALFRTVFYNLGFVEQPFSYFDEDK